MDYKDTLNLPRTGFPMKANLPQKEPEIIKYWEEIDLYKLLREESKDKKVFILHDGPPYANGHIHIGHTVNKVLKDIIVKSRQMTGFNSPYVPGWDCHGLPIEHNVEKELGHKKKDMSQLEIRSYCRRYADKFVKIQKEEFRRLGVCGDWENPYLTMTNEYEAAICREFCNIFLKDHVIKSKKPVYWCTKCVTALAEAEVEYASHKSPSITVKFPTGEALRAWLEQRFGAFPRPAFVLIWTTTPWTLPANLAVAVHPDHDYLAVEARGETWILAESRLHSILSELGLEQGDVKILGAFNGAEIEGMSLHHPFLERESLIILADFVTLDTGTGCVHIAPGHGTDDYESGLRYNLDILSPVDDYGRFTDAVPELAGKNIFDANKDIMEILEKNGRLLGSSVIEHSYPHCWRCKKPVIFRATSQWFISMEKENLRAHALSAINEVRWIPSWGKERIYGMVESRPDWCISRQRAWGVPITVFTCETCDTPFMDKKIADKIVSMFEKEGSDAWFSASSEGLLEPGTRCRECGGSSFKKEMDILDVWFDSGASFAAVLEHFPGLSFPADLYLEGSDQHRGWFQSSLLISAATRHQAPYRSVLTHGFVVDQRGRKMSKSEGNVIPPSDIIKQYGAEVLRLWVSAEDYHDDIKISKEILQRLTEAYRKIRNTIRYLLSNIPDFKPEQDSVPVHEMEPIDLWALSRLGELTESILKAYKDFKFHSVFHQVNQFCAVDMSAIYLDILKDRLYCELPKGRLRRSAQTVIHRIAHDLILLIAPILSFTAEEAWKYLPRMKGDDERSVFLSPFPAESLYKIPKDDVEEWELLWKLRSEITKALETARKEKHIGLALDAKVILNPPDDLKDFASSHLEILKQVSIVSQMEISGSLPAEGLQLKSEEIPGLLFTVIPASGKKCARCWTWSEDVGEDPSWPDACGRCAGVLKELGTGPAHSD